MEKCGLGRQILVALSRQDDRQKIWGGRDGESRKMRHRMITRTKQKKIDVNTVWDTIDTNICVYILNISIPIRG